MSAFALEARNLSRTFGAVKALDDVSLSLEAGKVLALLGQSGSGKSTLLRVLAGLESLDAGEVYADGRLVSDVRTTVPPEKRPLGMVVQDYALFPHLTALGNVAFGLGHLNKSDRLGLAASWLTRVGLGDRGGAFPHELSGGEQQRVALARALAPNPRAILMDEPFSGLDPHLRADLQSSMLATLAEAGVAALIVSHDTEEALAVADHVAIIEHGRILQSGLPRDVYRAPKSLEAARALGAVWSLDGHARNGRVETGLGTFDSPFDGPVVVCSRPEATLVAASDEGQHIVVDRRGVGRFLTLKLQAETGDGGFITALVEAKTAPERGQPVALSLLPEDVFVFKA
jgi:iron(III) transport system ATP-binding protein